MKAFAIYSLCVKNAICRRLQCGRVLLALLCGKAEGVLSHARDGDSRSVVTSEAFRRIRFLRAASADEKSGQTDRRGQID